MNWAALDIPQTGELNGQVRYFKHGFGCAVGLLNGAVDFDFGSAGEIDGFNTGRLAGFAGILLQEYGFSSENELRKVFDAEVKYGRIRYSGYVIYYLDNKD